MKIAGDSSLKRLAGLKEAYRQSADRQRSKNASQIWSEAIRMLDYVPNLSPENLLKIRYHCALFTGEDVFAYIHRNPASPEEFAKDLGYDSLTYDIPEKYRIGEPVNPHTAFRLGIEFEGRVINRCITRFQSCITNLYLTGVLERLEQSAKRSVVLEIGSGYGGLAHALGSLLRHKATYILLDFREILLMAGAYLITHNADASVYFYDPESAPKDFFEKEMYDYDFVLLPLDFFEDLEAAAEMNLVLNLMSFQEMTASQLKVYRDFAARKLQGVLYSYNLDCHPYNEDMGRSTVTEIFEEKFRLFPSKDFFEKFFPKERCHHLYKPFLGLPKSSAAAQSEPADIKVREFTPEERVSSLGFHKQSWKRVSDF